MDEEHSTHKYTVNLLNHLCNSLLGILGSLQFFFFFYPLHNTVLDTFMFKSLFTHQITSLD